MGPPQPNPPGQFGPLLLNPCTHQPHHIYPRGTFSSFILLQLSITESKYTAQAELSNVGVSLAGFPSMTYDP